MFYLRRCKLLIAFALGILILIGLTIQSPHDEFPNSIVLAAPRDIAPGPKDPYFISSIGMVWEPLIDVDEQGKIIGKLATSWSHDTSYKNWTFHLKKGVKFQDGMPFNADAVVKNVERWQHLGTKPSPFYTFNVKSMYPTLIGAKKIDDYTVELSFKAPQPVLIERMVRFPSAIFSPNCFDSKTGMFTKTAVGTGPFKIVGRKVGLYVKLERFDGYYGQKAKSKYIVIRNIPNAETRYSALKAGEIQGVLDLGALPPALAMDLLKDPRFAMTTNKNTINQFFLVNQSNFPFNDPRMIEAINLMINRPLVVESYFNKQATPTSGMLNSLSPAYKEYPLLYDETKAIKLAQEVLKGKTINTKFLIPQYGLNRYSYKEVAEYIQFQLKKLGINTTIVILDGAAHKKLLSQGQYTFSIGTHGLPSYAPESIMETYMASKGKTNELYHIGYKNKEADKLFAQLSKTNNPEERQIIYNKLQDEAYRRPATIPIASDLTALVYNRDLVGYKATTYGVTLSDIQKREGK